MTSDGYFVFGTSSSPFVGFIMLAVLLMLPIKVGAHLADAQRTGLIYCAVAALIGLIAGYFASSILGGSIGGPLAAFLGFVVGIRVVLGTTLTGALGLTIVSMGVLIVGLMVLSKF
jgi:hypothetical protein